MTIKKLRIPNMIPLMKNAFLNEAETKKALSEFILNSGRLSMDEQCYAFETEFADYQGRKDSILFNSGGSANLAILQALKNLGRLRNGSKIGFSALTWSTNIMPIIQLGMQPVAVDCDIYTLNVMSRTLLERLETEKLDALFITNAMGFAGDLPKIKEICEERSIILIEDNCEALGTIVGGIKTGNFGVAASFSFFVAHHMSTIEGGMAATDDEELAQMLRIVRANGWDRNLTKEQQSQIRKKHSVENEFRSKYIFYDLGFNMRPTEITGFIGRMQLKLLKDNVSKRESNYDLLLEYVRKNEDLVTLDRNHIDKLSLFGFPVVAKTKDLCLKYLERFVAANIEVRPMIAGDIQQQPFYQKYVNKIYSLPGAEFLHECSFYCGNYPELTDEDLKTISKCLEKNA